MKEGIGVFFKGAAMGAANVIPGVSGGTVAFITGIYERLIHAVKSVDATAVRLVLSGKFDDFAKRIDLSFLASLGAGIVVSILTLASVLKYLFANHEVLVWAFFFGLILASVYFVGKKVQDWSAGAVIGFLLGAGIAIGVALLKPASENDSIWYLLICGVVAMASMIIPGLSGSFVLLLLGNYQLIMIESVAGLKTLEGDAFRVLIPVGIGALLGVIALSRLLAWIFYRYHDLAVALLSGFVAGSLLIIWPWKEARIEVFEAAGKMKEKVIGYEWFFPEMSGETFCALGIMGVGFFAVLLMERFGSAKPGDDSIE